MSDAASIRYGNARILQNHRLYRDGSQIQEHQNAITQPTYWRATRLAIVVLVAIGITATIMIHYNVTFHSLGQRLKQLFSQQVGWKAGVILGSVGLTIGGAAFIIFRITRKQGKFWGDKQYKAIVIKQRKVDGKRKMAIAHPSMQLVDMSHPGEWKPTYERKHGEHDAISVAALIMAPIQTIGAIVYNAIRFCVIPFYILGRIAQEKITGKQAYPKERSFTFGDIGKQMGLSLWRVVKAPFYGVAYTAAIVYSFIEPLGGRKLGALICKEWMEGVERSDGTWICCCGASKDYKFEGGGGPDSLGHHAYYLTGCWQPWAEVKVEGETIQEARYPGNKFNWDVYLPGEDHIVPDLRRLPSVESDKTPMELAKELPLGSYRYVRVKEGVHVVAHVLNREGKELWIARTVTESIKDIDAFLNGYEDDECEIGDKPFDVLARRRSNLILDAGEQIPAIEGERAYRFVKVGEELFLQTDTDTVKLPPPKLVFTQLQPKQNATTPGDVKDLAYRLEAGECGYVQCGDDLYIIGHKQNPWGESLYCSRKLLEGEKELLDSGAITLTKFIAKSASAAKDSKEGQAYTEETYEPPLHQLLEK